MRTLTPQEIADAPDWATHYMIDKTVIHQNYAVIWLDDNVDASQPILRKEFDINSYAPQSNDIDCVWTEGCELYITVNGMDVRLFKEDVAAFAKHFEDLTGKSS